MRSTLTFSVPKNLAKQLEKASKEDGIPKSRILRESLEHTLFNRTLRALRKRLVPKARAMGIYTDEDVFKIVS